MRTASRIRLTTTTIFAGSILSGCQTDKGLLVYNSDPAFTITLPADGTEYNEGDTIEFAGLVDDNEDGPEGLT